MLGRESRSSFSRPIVPAAPWPQFMYPAGPACLRFAWVRAIVSLVAASVPSDARLSSSHHCRFSRPWRVLSFAVELPAGQAPTPKTSFEKDEEVEKVKGGFRWCEIRG